MSKFYELRAKVYKEVNKLNDAIKDYSKAIILDNNNDKLYNSRGNCHKILKN